MVPKKPVPHDPQNPYESFIVSASAGSGKTYQLSKRFLHLVAAGAPPSGILTVTFTKKAAAEMRARILSEAARLIGDHPFQKDFSERSAFFWQEACAKRSLQLAAPLAAPQVGRSILEQSQLLPIATIDSLLTQWVSKFPVEASATGSCRGKPWHDSAVGEFPNPYRLLDPNEAKPFNEMAWWAACRILANLMNPQDPPSGDSGPQPQTLRIQDLYTTKSRIEALTHQSTLIWYLEEMVGGGLRHFPTNEEDPQEQTQKLWDLLAEPLLEVAGKVSNPEVRFRIQSSVKERNFDGLLQSGIITKSDLGISGTYIRGKNRDSLVSPIMKIEHAVKSFVNQQRLSKLNETGTHFYHFYRLYQHARNTLKYQKNFLEFTDLTQGAFRLFHGDHGGGVRFLLSQVIHHVMLDEFQDTSRLQWSIFRELSESLLATPDLSRMGPQPSIFIVGDPKQSIYGFREADPAVLGEARNSLAPYINEVPLSTSYRTSPIVLEYINGVFSSEELRNPLGIPQFPPHQAARSREGVLLTPTYGGIYLADIPPPTPLLSKKSSDKESPAAKEAPSPPETTEAMVVAQMVRRILEHHPHETGHSGNPPPYGTQAFDLPIFDAKIQGYRPPKASDIAVLYRSGLEAQEIEQELHRAHILTRKEEEKGFFKRQEITDVLALLRVAISSEDRASLATVLKSPIGRCLVPSLTDTHILKSLWVSKKEKEDEQGHAFLKALSEDRDFTLHLLPQLEGLRKRAFSVSPHQFLYETYQNFQMMKIYGGSQENHKIATANLEKLLNLVLQLENQGYRDLISLSVKLGRMARDDLMGMAHRAQDAVTMMTIHKSKGLEFPIVFVVGCQNPWGQQESHWESSPSQDGIFYIGTQVDFPIDDPSFEEIRQTSVDRIARECGRLLYVALTRAKQYLVLVGKRPQRPQGLKDTVVFEALEAGLNRLALAPQSRLRPHGDPITAEEDHPSSQGRDEDQKIGPPLTHPLELHPHSPHSLEVRYVQSRLFLGDKPPSALREHTPPRTSSSSGSKAFSPSFASRLVAYQNSRDPLIDQLVPHGSLIQAPSRHQESAEEDLIRLFRANTPREQGTTDYLEPISPEMTTDPISKAPREGDGPHDRTVSVCPRLAKAAGIWLHKGLQCFVENIPFDRDLWWHTLAPPEYRDLRFLEPFRQDLTRCLKDPWLTEIGRSASFIRCEMPAVFKRKTNIFNCVIDLFLIDHEGVAWVIDYKSTRMNPPSSDQDQTLRDHFLMDFANTRGWIKQLRLYQESLKRIIQRHPDFWRAKGQKKNEIKGCLYFTSLQKPLLCPSLF